MNKIVLLAYKKHLRSINKKILLSISSIAISISILNVIFIRLNYIYILSLVLVAASLFIYSKYILISYRIDKDVFGNNYREMMELSKFIEKYSEHTNSNENAISEENSLTVESSSSVDEVK